MSVRRAAAVLAVSGMVATLCAGSAAPAATSGCQRPEWRSLVLVSTGTGAVDRGFPDVDGSVNAVLADGRGGWFVGGGFRCVGAVVAPGVVHLEADGALDPSWRGAVPASRQSESGVVAPTALALAGGKLLVAGRFGVEALNAASGAHQWLVRVRSKSATATGVDALATKGRVVYVGGDFRTIAGIDRAALAALDLGSGRVLAWRAHVGRTLASEPPYVSALAVSGSRLYVGSTNLVFAGAGQPRGIGALDARTGRALAWTPRRRGQTGYRAVGDVDTILVVRGEVLTAGRDGWGATSARTGRFMPWAYRIGARHFIASRALVYLGGDCRSSFTAAAGKPRHNLAAVDLATNRFTSWAPNVSKYTCVDAMAASRDQVLLAGSFTQTRG